MIVAVGILTIWSIKNKMRIDHQGWFNNASAIYQIISTLFVVFVIFSFSPKLAKSQFVFTTYNNDTGFSSAMYVSTLGLLTALYGFSGYEGGAHLAEETNDANIAAPKGIIYSCLLSFITGLLFNLAILYGTQGNINQVINGQRDHALVNIFSMVFSGNSLLTIVLTFIIILNLFLSGFSGMTVSSRIGYALARDGAFPFSKYLSKLNPETKTPDRIIMLMLTLSSLLCLLPLYSETAFTAITSLATVGV